MNSGIYKILNLTNNKIYIGSTNNFKIRENSHFSCLSKNKHHSQYLQRAFNIHGKENFVFKIIEKCSEDKLIIIEQFYIDILKPDYNMSMIAGKIEMNEETKLKISKSNTGKTLGIKRGPMSDLSKKLLSVSKTGKKLSEEHKDKIRNSFSKIKDTVEYRNKLSMGVKNSMTGEIRAKISLSHIGKKRKPFTDEHRRNISLAIINKKVKKWQITTQEYSQHH